MIGGSPTARAGTGGPLLYVDGAGSCAGLSPCFTTVQQAVRLVVAEDSEIRVFPGTYNESVDLDQAAADTGGTYGDLTIISVDSKGSEMAGAVVDGGQGAAFFTLSSLDADLVIDGFTVQSQGDDGIFVEADGAVTIRDVTANEAAGDGVSVDAVGDILIESSYANRSVPEKGSPDGFDLASQTGDVTVTGVQSASHTGPGDSNGIEIQAEAGNVLIHNTISNFNSAAGIAIESLGDVTVQSSRVEGNGDDGLLVEGAREVLVEFFGARTNAVDGVEITSLDDVTIRDSFALNNAGSGLLVASDGDVRIERASVIDNNLPPVRVGSQGNPGAIEVRPHPNSPNSSVDSLLIVGSLIQTNGADGILLSGTQNGTSVGITSNAICQNSGAGLTSLWNTTPYATNNWWGDPSGPAHPDNPGGSGDEITDANALFDPWITTVVGNVVSPPVLTNQPAQIAFDFTNQARDAEIEQGLGWPAAFEVTTSNGTLSSDVPGQEPAPSVAAQIVDGALAVGLIAASEGNANIELSGPCGLDGDLQVPVQPGTLFGDVDCNGSVDTVDALKINRHVAGLAVIQTEPCPDIGTPSASRLGSAGESLPFGDLDCDGIITPVDALAVLRHVASLPPLQVPKSCPEIGI